MGKPSMLDNPWSRATVRKAVRSPGTADAPVAPAPVHEEGVQPRAHVVTTLQVAIYRDFAITRATQHKIYGMSSMNLPKGIWGFARAFEEGTFASRSWYMNFAARMFPMEKRQTAPDDANVR